MKTAIIGGIVLVVVIVVVWVAYNTGPRHDKNDPTATPTPGQLSQ